jgi:hypothetical protein
MYKQITWRTVILVGNLLLVFTFGCRPVKSTEGWREQNQKLTQLLNSRATKSQIEAKLGNCQTYYAKSDTNWVLLRAYLARDRRADISAQIGNSTKVMYYTTGDLMTWVVLDDQERIINFYLCGQ